MSSGLTERLKDCRIMQTENQGNSTTTYKECNKEISAPKNTGCLQEHHDLCKKKKKKS